MNDMPLMSCGITTPKEVDDRALVERLIAAFRRADEAACYGEGSQWREFRSHHDGIVQSIVKGDVLAVQNLGLIEVRSGGSAVVDVTPRDPTGVAVTRNGLPVQAAGTGRTIGSVLDQLRQRTGRK